MNQRESPTHSEAMRILSAFITKTNTKRFFLFFEKKIKVLHFAPEKAFLSKFKKLENISYDTIDLNSPLADIKADICNLPLKDNTYDFILCNHVLEHIINDKKAMQELYRVLKKGGIGIFQVPIDITKNKTFEDFSITDPKERNKLFGQYDHVRIYGMDFFDRLINVGFKVERTTNDMPIIHVKNFKALQMIPFNINPHYLDPIKGHEHMGETRETRIKEFHKINDQTVIGLREGSFLNIIGNDIILKGSKPAAIFKKGKEKFEIDNGFNLKNLI